MPSQLGFQGDVLSQEILTKLTTNIDFTIPNVDFTAPGFTIPESLITEWLKQIKPLTIDQLTEAKLDGTGVFDVILKTLKIHLAEEQKAGRIVGAEYAKAFIALTQVALESSVQFITTRDTAYWQAVQGQLAAITANINTFTAKTQLAIAQAQAHNTKAQYAQTVMSLGVADAQFASTTAQLDIYKEQKEQLRAQTLDVRTDGQNVVGAIGKQKSLYDAQIDSYKKDAELKAAKVWADAFTTQKSLDEGTVAPNVLNSSTIDQVLNTLKRSNNL